MDIYTSYINQYSPSGTNLGDGVTSGDFQSSVLNSRGVRSDFVKISSIQPAAPVTLITKTIQAGTNPFPLIDISTFGFAPSIVRLTKINNETCYELDCSRKISLTSTFAFSAQVSGYDGAGNKLYASGSASGGTFIYTTLFAFKFITSIYITFATPASGDVILKTTNVVEIPTTDYGTIASYFIWNGAPYYQVVTSNLLYISGSYSRAAPNNVIARNTLPMLTLTPIPDGIKALTVLSLNTGYGAPIDMNASVRKLLPQPLVQNRDPSMIKGIKNNSGGSSWRGWSG